MEMVYNSSQFAVVAFEVPSLADGAVAGERPAAGAVPVLARGGFEIVDKHARKEIFIEGALAEHFHQGVQALVAEGPSEEALDDFIAGFTQLAQQPVVVH